MIKKFNRKHYGYVVAIATLLVAFYAIFTMGQTFMHSDNTVGLRMLRGIVREKSLWPITWNAANGEVMAFHNNMLTIIASAIFSNKVFARVLASAITLLLTVLGLVAFARVYLKNDSWVISAPILAVFISSANARDMLLYQGAYLTPMIALSFCFMVSYLVTVETGHSKKIIVANIICTFLMALEGVRYFAEFTIPLFATLFLVMIFKKDWKIVKRTLIHIVIPCAIGFGLYQIIAHTHIMNSSMANSIEPEFDIEIIRYNIRNAYENLQAIFGHAAGFSKFRNGIAKLVAVAVGIVVPILALLLCKKEEDRVKHYYLFGFIHNIMMLGVIVLLGKFAQRYLLSSVFVAIIITAHFIYKYFFENKKALAYLSLAAYTFFCVWYARSLFTSTIGWQEILQSERHFCDELEDRGIVKGYASYWNAYTNEIYSDGKIQFGGVSFTTRKVNNYYWLVDEGVFEPVDGKCCIVFDEEEYEQFGSTAWRQGTEPADVFVVDDVYIYNFYTDSYSPHTMYVFEYDHDIVDAFSNGFHDNRLDIREMYFENVGEIKDDSVEILKDGKTYGPIFQMNAGHYTVKFEGKNLKNSIVEALSDTNQEALSFDVVKSTDDYVIMDLTVSDYIYDMQLVLRNETEDSMMFYDILVEEQ